LQQMGFMFVNEDIRIQMTVKLLLDWFFAWKTFL